jgi:catechol 2,3-dioxygenase-like lactoylglutathione lyase family enzyme
MLATTKAYSGFAVDDMDKARDFYAGTLGLRTSEEYDLMWLHLAGERDTLVYHQPAMTPASCTILNFEVDDIDHVVDDLVARGVRFEPYDGVEQDSKGTSERRAHTSPGSRTRAETCSPFFKRDRGARGGVLVMRVRRTRSLR